MHESNRPKKALAALVVISLLGILAGSSYFLQQDKTNNTDLVLSDNEKVVFTPPAETADTDESQQTGTIFTDGEYELTKRYATPEGTESIKVTVSLDDDVITDVEITASMKDREAAEHQGDFLADYKQHVVGKPISSLSLSRVAGASLTTRAFNSAIQVIREDARI